MRAILSGFLAFLFCCVSSAYSRYSRSSPINAGRSAGNPVASLASRA